MVDYPNTFAQFGAELRNVRKLAAVWEHSHFSSNVNFSKRLISSAYDETIDEEELAETSARNHLENVLTQVLVAQYAAQVGALEVSFFGALEGELALTEQDRDAGAIEYDYDEGVNGSRTIARRNGFLGNLRSNMVADAETIEDNLVARVGDPRQRARRDQGTIPDRRDVRGGRCAHNRLLRNGL